MNRFASIVGSAAAFAAASLCSAQTARPYMYIWAAPTSGWNPEIAAYVSQVVRFGADWFNNPNVIPVRDPAMAAEEARDMAEDRRGVHRRGTRLLHRAALRDGVSSE